MTSKIIYALQLLGICVGLAQSPKDESSSKLKFNFSVEVGKSQFSSNIVKSTSKFITPEIRFGFGATRRLNKYFDWIAGLNFGAKIKGERKYPPGSTPGISVRLPPPYNVLEETVNSQNHYFIEIPLLVQYNLPSKNIGLRTGINYRQFFKNNGYLDSSGQFNEPDFLNRRKEIGVLSQVTIKPSSILKKLKNVSPKFKLTGTYFFALSNIYKEYYTQIDSYSDISYSVKNRFWQLGLEYYFRD